MRRPPDLEMRSPTTRQGDRAISQKNLEGPIDGGCKAIAASESEILVPDSRAAKAALSEADQVLTSGDVAAAPRAYSIKVDRQLKRTTAPHGLTRAELKRLSGAMHLLKKQTRRAGTLWLLSTAKSGLSRSIIADIQKRVGRYQRDADLEVYYIRVMETRPRPHAHIVFIGSDEIAARLKNARFGNLIDVRLVTDPDGLSKKYLAKERTPQAGYKRTDLGGRIKGSHRLDGGGDRVALSRDLERDAIEAGLVDAWQHTNGKRSSGRKDYRPRKIEKRALKAVGQMLLFPELEKPVSRLRQFGGGIMPPAVALETEFLRKQRGFSQYDLAKRIARSQGQYSNAIRGHDPISAISVNRIRELLSA